VVKTILKVLNKSEDLIEFVEDRPGHDFRYSLNSSKISKKLGWSVKASFEDSIKKTIQWYLNNPDIFGNTSLITSDFTPWKNSNK
jgi:dTDP-glucose 4,6-dehydratase